MLILRGSAIFGTWFRLDQYISGNCIYFVSLFLFSSNSCLWFTERFPEILLSMTRGFLVGLPYLTIEEKNIKEAQL